MISWSQNGIKMQSSYLLILYSGIPTSEFLPGSVHHRAGTWVFLPGLMHICAYLLGCYFMKFGIVISGFSSEMKEPKLHKLGIFQQIMVKNIQLENWVLSFKIGCFPSKMLYWSIDDCAKKWYRKSQMFEVWQHIYVQVYNLTKVSPPGAKHTQN